MAFLRLRERIKKYLTATALVCCFSHASVVAEPLDVNTSYTNKGLTFITADERFKIQFQARIQSRFATPNDNQPTAVDDYYSNDGNEQGINRARLKIRGHAYQPWLKYAIEYDLRNSFLLNYTLQVEKIDWLKFKVGQWKFEYSRERSISSGGQQMLDRSIINRIFTIDRQQGVALYGNLDGGGMANFNYWLGTGTGTGRGSSANDGDERLYYGRLQWNILGEAMGFKASDLAFSQTPKASVAVAYSANQSAFTRFSSSGGGQLEKYSAGFADRYKINQYNIDTAFMYNGLSAQAEYHRKSVDDISNQYRDTDYVGYYVQAGYLGHAAYKWWPEPLEVAFRFATYRERENSQDEKHFERAVAVNWFFNGHNNKLTADVTRFDLEQQGMALEDETRFRLQWDVSF